MNSCKLTLNSSFMCGTDLRRSPHANMLILTLRLPVRRASWSYWRPPPSSSHPPTCWSLSSFSPSKGDRSTTSRDYLGFFQYGGLLNPTTVHSSFVVRHLSFIICRSSFVIHHHHHFQHQHHQHHHSYLFSTAFFTLSPSSSQRLRWVRFRWIDVKLSCRWNSKWRQS